MRILTAREQVAIWHQSAEDELNSYLQQAHRNLLATSRTARGVVDTSASPDKAKNMSGVGGQEAADLATNNFHDAIRAGYSQRDRQFNSPDDVRQFVEGLGATVNKGILAPGASLLRQHDSDKFPYTRVKDMGPAMDKFYGDLHQGLNNPNVDPVHLAAYGEYHVDPGIHMFADGAGKTAKALSSYILMRHGMPLPTYEGGRDAYYNAVTRTTPHGQNPAADQQAFGNFLNYYRGMMPKTGTPPQAS